MTSDDARAIADANIAQAMIGLLTIEQVLRLIPVSRATLFNMERRGDFPKGFFISNNRKVWRTGDIAEWQRNLPTEAPPRRRGNNSGRDHKGGRGRR